MWAQIINALLGVWTMVTPSLLPAGQAASDNNHIVGPVIATFAIVAWWEATRVVRLYNVPLGAWLIAAPWVLGYEATGAIANSMVTGLLVVLLSFVEGKIEHQFGGGWSSLMK